MTRFVKMELRNGKLVEVEAFDISAKQLAACPHAILVAEHYRRDGTCHCDNPDATIMKEWGYTWRDGLWRSEESD